MGASGMTSGALTPRHQSARNQVSKKYHALKIRTVDMFHCSGNV
jgi:hypothetical protein